MPVHLAVSGAGTVGQMEDTIRAVQTGMPHPNKDVAALRNRAIVGQDD